MRIDSQSDSYRLQETKWAELLAPGNLRTQPDSLAREPPSFLWAETCLRDGSVNSTDGRQTSHSVSAPSAITRRAFYRARLQLGVWPFSKKVPLILLPFRPSSFYLPTILICVFFLFFFHGGTRLIMDSNSDFNIQAKTNAMEACLCVANHIPSFTRKSTLLSTRSTQLYVRVASSNKKWDNNHDFVFTAKIREERVTDYHNITGHV